MSTNRLFRSDSDKMVAGVCGGLAAYLDMDPVFVRLGFIILGFASGISIPLYIAMAVIAPTKSGLDMEDMIHFGDDIGSGGASPEVQRNRNSVFMAGLLIVAGAYFLFGNFGINIWPIALIALGTWLVVRRSG
ncbi:MAG: PspC domain-containing protein [Candidatus Promineifilaceae bacterium]